jgi:NADPH:quinone reductase
MRAAYIEAFGGAEQVKVGERPDPTPGEGEVLIRNRAAGVGIWDVKFIAGMFGDRPMPLIPGFEASGVVEAADDVSGVSRGDEVYAQLGAHHGGYAELVVARADHVAAKPASISHAQAAGLVIGAGTAYEGLIERAEVQPGETVLVTAASGGVGVYALQIAVSAGATVFGVAGASHHQLLRDLGAAETFDYHDTDWVARVKAAAPAGVDVLFDGAGEATRDQAVDAVRDGGRGVFIAGAPTDLPRGITGAAFSADPTTARLRSIADLVDTGQVRAVVDGTYALDDAAKAVAHVATRHATGRVAITFE